MIQKRLPGTQYPLTKRWLFPVNSLTHPHWARHPPPRHHIPKRSPLSSDTQKALAPKEAPVWGQETPALLQLRPFILSSAILPRFRGHPEEQLTWEKKLSLTPDWGQVS